MPIYRYDGNGVWLRLKNIYRKGSPTNDNVWVKMKAIYRKGAPGNDSVWVNVFSSTLEPTSATPFATLRNETNLDPDLATEASLFKGGNIVSLTRGNYTNTTADTQTKYTMSIVRSINFDTNIANWETVSGPTIFYGNNSTSSTAITYIVTDDDAKGQYYIAGRIRVDTDPSDPNSTVYNFPIKTTAGLAKVSHAVSSLTTSNVTDNDVTFTWDVTGITDSTYIHSQTLKIRSGSATGPDVISPITGIPVNTRVYTVTNDPNLAPSTSYFGRIEVVANDGWKTSANPTLQVRSVAFNTTAVLPVNTVAPTVTPLNSRLYAPKNTQLVCSTGSWSNVNANTVYSYQWQYYDQAGVGEDGYRNFTETGNNTNTFIVPNSALYSKARCKVTARNGTDTPVTAFANWGDTLSNLDSQVTINAYLDIQLNIQLTGETELQMKHILGF